MSSNNIKIPPAGKKVFASVEEIIDASPWMLPEDKYKGSGGPGNYLEDLLSIKVNNADLPDLAGWEVKFHGGKSLLTLLHKEPSPQGAINRFVDDYGWLDKHGRISFRHTFAGDSKKGFLVKDEDEKIVIRNTLDPKNEAYWDHNTIFSTFAAKLRRLIVVGGTVSKNPRSVKFKNAVAFWDPNMTSIIKAIENGLFHIDFDARTNGPRGTSIRNHGTKFRIKLDDLDKVYLNKLVVR